MPSFFTSYRDVTYRFPHGIGFGTFKKGLKGCRAGHRASSLTATLDSYQAYSFIYLLL